LTLRRDKSARYKSPVEMTLMRAIKHALDLHGLMNPEMLLPQLPSTGQRRATDRCRTILAKLSLQKPEPAASQTDQRGLRLRNANSRASWPFREAKACPQRNLARWHASRF
jgi:hypothetical protein